MFGAVWERQRQHWTIGQDTNCQADHLTLRLTAVAAFELCNRCFVFVVYPVGFPFHMHHTRSTNFVGDKQGAGVAVTATPARATALPANCLQCVDQAMAVQVIVANLANIFCCLLQLGNNLRWRWFHTGTGVLL